MQSEILFVFKLGGIILGVGTHFYYIIKLIVLLQERQKNTHKRLLELENIVDDIKKQHEMNHRRKRV